LAEERDGGSGEVHQAENDDRPAFGGPVVSFWEEEVYVV
jgi:hypothetical protein